MLNVAICIWTLDAGKIWIIFLMHTTWAQSELLCFGVSAPICRPLAGVWTKPSKPPAYGLDEKRSLTISQVTSAVSVRIFHGVHKRSGYLVCPRPLATAGRTRTTSDPVSHIGIPITTRLFPNLSQSRKGSYGLVVILLYVPYNYHVCRLACRLLRLCKLSPTCMSRCILAAV